MSQPLGPASHGQRPAADACHLFTRVEAAEAAWSEGATPHHASRLVEAWTAVVAVEPTAEHLCELGNVLLSRYELTGAERDLAAARRCNERAVELDEGNNPGYLNNLGQAVRATYQHTGDADWLDRATAVLADAVRACGETAADLPTCLDNLAICLIDRYDIADESQLLNDAIDLHERALALCGADHAFRPLFMTNLGAALYRRYQYRADEEDLDASIAAYTQALSVTGDNDPERAMRLANLGSALLDRYGHAHDADDLHSAVALCAEAVATGTAEGYEPARWLLCLGDALSQRNLLRGGVADLDDAIGAYTAALDRAPSGSVIWPSIAGQPPEPSGPRPRRHIGAPAGDAPTFPGPDRTASQGALASRVSRDCR